MLCINPTGEVHEHARHRHVAIVGHTPHLRAHGLHDGLGSVGADRVVAFLRDPGQALAPRPARALLAAPLPPAPPPPLGVRRAARSFATASTPAPGGGRVGARGGEAHRRRRGLAAPLGVLALDGHGERVWRAELGRGAHLHRRGVARVAVPLRQPRAPQLRERGRLRGGPAAAAAELRRALVEAVAVATAASAASATTAFFVGAALMCGPGGGLGGVPRGALLAGHVVAHAARRARDAHQQPHGRLVREHERRRRRRRAFRLAAPPLARRDEPGHGRVRVVRAAALGAVGLGEVERGLAVRRARARLRAVVQQQLGRRRVAHEARQVQRRAPLVERARVDRRAAREQQRRGLRGAEQAALVQRRHADAAGPLPAARAAAALPRAALRPPPLRRRPVLADVRGRVGRGRARRDHLRVRRGVRARGLLQQRDDLPQVDLPAAVRVEFHEQRADLARRQLEPEVLAQAVVELVQRHHVVRVLVEIAEQRRGGHVQALHGPAHRARHRAHRVVALARELAQLGHGRARRLRLQLDLLRQRLLRELVPAEHGVVDAAPASAGAPVQVFEARARVHAALVHQQREHGRVVVRRRAQERLHAPPLGLARGARAHVGRRLAQPHLLGVEQHLGDMLVPARARPVPRKLQKHSSRNEDPGRSCTMQWRSI